MFYLFKPTLHTFKEKGLGNYPIAVVAIRMEGSHTPHFGLIFDLPWRLIEKMSPGNVCPWLAHFLGEHKDFKNWDFKNWEIREGEKSREAVLLLVPKRYVALSFVIGTFLIRLVPKQSVGVIEA